MRRSHVVLLVLGLLSLGSGCGMVEDSARRVVAGTLGEGAASLLGDAPSEERGAPQGLSIAADEEAAGEIAAGDDSGAPGFYKIVEANGTVRFTSNLSDVPVAQRPKAERLAMAPSKPSAPVRAAPSRPRLKLPFLDPEQEEQPPAARARTSAGSHEVVLYTTSWCGWCKRTITWLDQQGVPYVNKDVERDDDAAAEMRDLVGGDSGVPVVVIDGEVIQGFDQRRMEKLLEI